jgi:ABC-type multidrug transport system ATPase subunit
MILVKEISKSYGRQEILRSASFEVRPGEVTLLAGANGVGKTTLLRALSGFLKPDGGDAAIAGVSIVKHRVRAQEQMSYLPQGIAFHPRLTCEAVLRFYADVRGVGRERVEFALEAAGLTAHAQKKTGALSGGLRQRLGLAVLLLPDAPVLMLDEPGLSLDPEWRERLQAILSRESRAGKTVLVTTHLLGEWEDGADRVLLARRGHPYTDLNPARLREEFNELTRCEYSIAA